MKLLTNDSLQRLEVYFDTSIGSDRRWIMPKETIMIPEAFISHQIRVLSQRRMISIKNA
jgi:hypothetical protein